MSWNQQVAGSPGFVEVLRIRLSITKICLLYLLQGNSLFTPNQSGHASGLSVTAIGEKTFSVGMSAMLATVDLGDADPS
jgi:hypothetical protein